MFLKVEKLHCQQLSVAQWLSTHMFFIDLYAYLHKLNVKLQVLRKQVDVMLTNINSIRKETQRISVDLNIHTPKYFPSLNKQLNDFKILEDPPKIWKLFHK